AAPHGVGLIRIAGGKCGDQEPAATEGVDAGQHRGDEEADEAPRLRLRLVEGSDDLFAGLLPLEPVVLPEVLREGPGLSQKEPGELVSGVRHRAGERTGGGWLLL